LAWWKKVDWQLNEREIGFDGLCTGSKRIIAGLIDGHIEGKPNIYSVGDNSKARFLSALRLQCGSSLQRNDAGVWLCEYPGPSFQRCPVRACSLLSSLLLNGATMSQEILSYAISSFCPTSADGLQDETIHARAIG